MTELEIADKAIQLYTFHHSTNDQIRIVDIPPLRDMYSYRNLIASGLTRVEAFIELKEDTRYKHLDIVAAYLITVT